MEICLSDGQRLLVFGFHQDDMDAAIEAFNQLQLHEKVTHFFFDFEHLTQTDFLV